LQLLIELKHLQLAAANTLSTIKKLYYNCLSSFVDARFGFTATEVIRATSHGTEIFRDRRIGQGVICGLVTSKERRRSGELDPS
jgi:hypothetical protein